MSTGGGRTSIDPYIEANSIASWQISPGSDVVTYTQLAAGVDASIAGRNNGGSVSLRSNAGGPLGGFATLRYIGAQNEDDLGLLLLDDALTLDAGLSWRFANGISVEARGENLFDETVVTRNAGGSIDLGTPRTLWIGVNWRH